ncbi:DUF3991 domain-containing protein [Carnobacterium maltaromaticum]|uniref:DUF3991 domain-containing protein n=1 Tax=Carnobacterium maltaromaticum TaxID=2751 RepID=UPI0018CFA748|nr:DUF3991 domain-containing protein [Carnobacterium maltaromaticum]
MTEVKEKKDYQFFSKEEIKELSKISIESYIHDTGIGQIEGKGRHIRFLIGDSKSCVIDTRKNYFVHNANPREGSGGIINFVMYYEGLSFTETLKKLSSDNFEFEQVDEYGEDEEEAEKKVYNYSVYEAKNTDIILNYLINERQLDQDVVQYLLDNEFMLQDTANRAVMLWRDSGTKDGKIIGSNRQGTVTDFSKWERGTEKKVDWGSDNKNWGFNITLGTPKKLIFFEAFIDLLSYWSLNKDLNDCRLVAMEGTGKKIVESFIQDTYSRYGTLPTEGLYYGTDNDAVGQSFYDYMRYRFGDKQTNDGEEIKNISIIPFDQHLNKEHVALYQEIGAATDVEWELLAAFHKIEVNLSLKDRISNDFNYGKYFGKRRLPSEKPNEIDLRSCLEQLASDINLFSVNVNDSNLKKLIETDVEVKKNEDKLSKFMNFETDVRLYYTAYKNKEYELVDELLKDFNDELKQKRDRGLVTEYKKLAALDNIPENELDHVENKEPFNYYLDKHENTTVARNFLVQGKKISPEIVDVLIQKGMIRQDGLERVIFAWGSKGKIVGGDIQGTLIDKKLFKGGTEKKIMDNSDTTIGFNITLGTPKHLLLFADPISLLSFWSLHQALLTNCILQTIPELNPDQTMEIINKKLQDGIELKKVSFCVGHGSVYTDFLDTLAQHESFNPQAKLIATSSGRLGIPVASNRPRYGVDWPDELQAKHKRVEKLRVYHQTPQPKKAPEREQVVAKTL